MRATETDRSVKNPGTPPVRWVPILLLGCVLLAGCASGKQSVEDLGLLARDLTACLPPPPDGWEVRAMEINEETTRLDKGKIDAARDYVQTGGQAEMEVSIRTSRWCCWLVVFSGDLQETKIQGRRAGLDARKNKAVLYVPLTHEIVVTFEADNMENAADTVMDFAQITDFDCLKKRIKKK